MNPCKTVSNNLWVSLLFWLKYVHPIRFSIWAHKIWMFQNRFPIGDRSIVLAKEALAIILHLLRNNIMGILDGKLGRTTYGVEHIPCFLFLHIFVHSPIPTKTMKIRGEGKWRKWLVIFFSFPFLSFLRWFYFSILFPRFTLDVKWNTTHILYSKNTSATHFISYEVPWWTEHQILDRSSFSLHISSLSFWKWEQMFYTPMLPEGWMHGVIP